MNLKKILAATAAGALAVSSMAVSAFAADKTGSVSTDVNVDADAGKWVIASSDIPENCETIKIDVVIPEGGYGGGCVGYNDANEKWTRLDWENGKTTSFEIATSGISDASDIQCQVWWLGGCDAITFEATFELADEPATAPEQTVSGNITFNSPVSLTAENDGKYSITVKPMAKDETAENPNAEWNDWCTLVVTIKDGENVSYRVLAGAQVGWPVTVDDKGTEDTSDDIKYTSADTDVWTAVNGETTITLDGINAGATIEVKGLSWDTNGDEPYMACTIKLEEVASGDNGDEPTTPDEPKVDEPSTEEPTTPEEPTTEETPKDDAPATGVAVAFAGLALAGTAVVATKKRK